MQVSSIDLIDEHREGCSVFVFSNEKLEVFIRPSVDVMRFAIFTLTDGPANFIGVNSIFRPLGIEWPLRLFRHILVGFGGKQFPNTLNIVLCGRCDPKRGKQIGSSGQVSCLYGLVHFFRRLTSFCATVLGRVCVLATIVSTSASHAPF